MSHKDPVRRGQYNRAYYLAHQSEIMDALRPKARERARLGRAYITQIKEANPRVDCGKFYPACVMDFDHTADDKLSGVSTLASASRKTIDVEIAKCELVCANCHRIRTYITRRSA